MCSVSAISGFESPSTSCKQERGPVVGRQIVDGGGQHRAQLGLERRLLDAPDQSRRGSACWPSSSKAGGRSSQEISLPLAVPAAELLVRRVGGDPVHPAAEGRLALEGVDLARGRPERVLHHFLGILLVARDADGQPVDAVAVGGDQLLRARRAPAARRRSTSAASRSQPSSGLPAVS